MSEGCARKILDLSEVALGAPRGLSGTADANAQLPLPLALAGHHDSELNDPTSTPMSAEPRPKGWQRAQESRNKRSNPRKEQHLAENETTQDYVL